VCPDPDADPLSKLYTGTLILKPTLTALNGRHQSDFPDGSQLDFLPNGGLRISQSFVNMYSMRHDSSMSFSTR